MYRVTASIVNSTLQALRRAADYILEHRVIALVALLVGIWPAIELTGRALNYWSSQKISVEIADGIFWTEEQIFEAHAALRELNLNKTTRVDVAINILSWEVVDISSWNEHNEIETFYRFAEESYISAGLSGSPLASSRFQFLISAACHETFLISGSGIDKTCD